MNFIVAVVGVLEVLGGLLVFGAAKSAIHEILGAVGVGLGMVTIALSVVIVRLTDILDELKRRP